MRGFSLTDSRPNILLILAERIKEHKYYYSLMMPPL